NLSNTEMLRPSSTFSKYTQSDTKWLMPIPVTKFQDKTLQNEDIEMEENQIPNNQQIEGGGKQMSNKVKKMLERMFLFGNLNPKDCMNTKDMYERLKEFSNNGELEEEEIPKVNTIQLWISRFTQKFKESSTKAALQTNLSKGSLAESSTVNA
ncbi:8104_t:CDS:2, partial [Funneliformis caledonium]